MPPMETVSAIRARRVRASLRSDGWRIALLGAALLGAVLGNRPAEQPFLAIVLAGVVLVVIWVQASGSAEDDFLTAWARAHGLAFVESPGIGSGTPLLRQGSNRVVELENGELLVAVKHHLSEQAPLDALLEQSRAVLQRIAAATAPADRSLS